MTREQPAVDPILRFSTRAIAPKVRFDFFMSALASSLWQVSDWSGTPKDFTADMRASPLGALTAVLQSNTSHHSHRTKADVERSQERSFHLFVSTRSPWAFTHQGRHERLEPGDVVIFGEGEHETHAPDGFHGVIVKCPETWIRTWLADPTIITGRNLKQDSRWGRVLSPMLQQLTPEFATTTPLPPSVIADQLGTVLALMAQQTEARRMPDLMDAIREQIRQRAHLTGLTASDVAAALDIPVAHLNQALIGCETSFALELRRARALVAARIPGKAH